MASADRPIPIPRRKFLQIISGVAILSAPALAITGKETTNNQEIKAYPQSPGEDKLEITDVVNPEVLRPQDMDMGDTVVTASNLKVIQEIAYRKSPKLPITTISIRNRLSYPEAQRTLKPQDEEQSQLLYRFGLNNFMVGVDESTNGIGVFLRTSEPMVLPVKYLGDPPQVYPVLIHTVDETYLPQTSAPFGNLKLNNGGRNVTDIYMPLLPGIEDLANSTFVVQINAGFLNIGKTSFNSFLLPTRFQFSQDPYVPVPARNRNKYTTA